MDQLRPRALGFDRVAGQRWIVTYSGTALDRLVAASRSPCQGQPCW